MKNRKTRNIIVSTLLHALLIVGVYTFQGGIFPYIRIGGLVPLLLPIVATGVALCEGRDTGGICGLFTGILCDISFNQPVGTFTVLLTAVGLGIGILSDTIMLSTLATYYISCAAVLLLCAFIQMVPIFARAAYTQVGDIIIVTIMQTIYSLVLAFPIWFAVRALGKRADSITPSGRMV